MVKKILSITVIAVIALSGCSATKAEVEAPKKVEVADTNKSAVETKTVKAVAEKMSGVAASVPASEFFKK
ncbi:MAG: hypothetical protein K0U38_04005 [Epsilonproteobacteria bacterium]|nr:hypothetical protein [Campylobacterota bacterium]